MSIKMDELSFFSVKQLDLTHLLQSGLEVWSLILGEAEQAALKGHVDEASQSWPEVVSIGVQPLHELPATSHCLHTECLVATHQLQPNEQNNQKISLKKTNNCVILRLTWGKTIWMNESTGSTRSLGSRVRASSPQRRAALWASAVDAGIPKVLKRKFRQIHWSRMNLAAMSPQSCCRIPCASRLLPKEEKDYHWY